MPANRRRHANAVPIASIATWILVAAFFCCAGLGYVYCKNQLHTSGATIKELEKELQNLRTENEVVRSKIASLSSHEALKKKPQQIKDVYKSFIPIAPDRIVYVNDASRNARSNFQPVSNTSVSR